MRGKWFRVVEQRAKGFVRRPRAPQTDSAHRRKPDYSALARADRMLVDEILAAHQKSAMSECAFSESLGLSRNTLSLWKLGKRGLGFSVAVHVANLLGIDLGAIQRKCRGAK